MSNKYLTKIAEKYKSTLDMPDDELNRGGISTTFMADHIARKHGHDPLNEDDLFHHYMDNHERAAGRAQLTGLGGAALGATLGAGVNSAVKAIKPGLSRGKTGVLIGAPAAVGGLIGAWKGHQTSIKNQANELHQKYGPSLSKTAASLKEEHAKLEDPSYARMAGKGALYGIGGKIVGGLAGGVLTSPLHSLGRGASIAASVAHTGAALGGLGLGAYQGVKSSIKNQIKDQATDKALAKLKVGG